jgi:hypothetical protein
LVIPCSVDWQSLIAETLRSIAEFAAKIRGISRPDTSLGSKSS